MADFGWLVPLHLREKKSEENLINEKETWSLVKACTPAAAWCCPCVDGRLSQLGEDVDGIEDVQAVVAKVPFVPVSAPTTTAIG